MRQERMEGSAPWTLANVRGFELDWVKYNGTIEIGFQLALASGETEVVVLTIHDLEGNAVAVAPTPSAHQWPAQGTPALVACLVSYMVESRSTVVQAMELDQSNALRIRLGPVSVEIVIASRSIQGWSWTLLHETSATPNTVDGVVSEGGQVTEKSSVDRRTW